MRRESANIRSPEVIRRFRHRFVEFSEHGHRIVDTVKGDVSSVSSWLRGEQLRHWKSQQRRWHDRMKEAWRDYVNARYGDRRMGKTSCVEERLAYERARRKKEEAEKKIIIVRRWADALEREASRLMPPCLRFEGLLVSSTPKALARLDHMLDNLEEYLRPSAPKSEKPADG